MKIRSAIQLMMAVGLIVVLAFAGLTVSAQQQPSGDTPAFLGIRFIPNDNGVEVTEVITESPADQAGLQVGDVITEVDGNAINAREFAQTIRSHAVGDTLALSVLRDGDTTEVSVTLVEVPANLLPVQRAGGFLGLSLEASADGLTISSVAEGSPAADAGLQNGDILLAIGDTQVSTMVEAREAVRSLEPGATIDLHISRNGEEQTITLTVGTVPASSDNLQFNEFSYDAATQSWSIGRISEDSPLYEAGLREGDVITVFNGETYDLRGLMQFIIGLAQDATVTLTVQRGDETLSIDVPASALQMMGMRGGVPFGGQPGSGREPGNSSRDGIPFAMGGVHLGVTFLTLDAQVASENNVTQTDGALITQVDEGSPAADAGLQANDIVTAVDGDSVDAEHTLRDRLFAYEPGDVITLDVVRGDETLQIQVTLGQPETEDSLPFRFFFGEPGTQQPVNPPPPVETPAA
jgi:S1-C subfamily serine protease